MAMLFPEVGDLPEGFVYREDVLSSDEEARLVEGLRTLAFGEVRMRGQVARRRTIHFGWTYGYETWRVEPGPPIPEFLVGLRALPARVAGVEGDALAEVLVTHYPPGAGIGWHRDAPAFGVVVGVSLLGASVSARVFRAAPRPCWKRSRQAPTSETPTTTPKAGASRCHPMPAPGG